MNPKATIHYRDIGDCLTHKQKLALVRECGSVAAMPSNVYTSRLRVRNHDRDYNKETRL
jgi:predicted helicase